MSIATGTPKLVCCAFVVAFVVAFIGGCGGEASQRRAIQGRVRLDSVDVAKGSITLLPSDGNRGPAVSTAIVAGRYQFNSETGPYPGSHRVIVGIDRTKELAPAAANGVQATDSATGKLAPAPASRRENSGEATGPVAEKSQWTTRFVIPADGDQRRDFDFATDAS